MVRTSETQGVVTVRIDRPPVNALDVPTIDALADAFTDARSHRGLVLTGSGSTFSAGVDVRAFVSGGAAGRARLAAAINRMVCALVSIDGPAIAAIDGHALGGGLVLALATDLRVVAEGSARLGLTEVQAGVAYPAAAVEVVRAKLPALLGDRLVLRGEIVHPQEAASIGLVDEVVPAPELVDRATAHATRLASEPGYRVVKAQFLAARRARLAHIADLASDPVLPAWEQAARGAG